ncbi:MAG: hypothetical protein WAU58_20395, partial [Terriglobales bacterium]
AAAHFERGAEIHAVLADAARHMEHARQRRRQVLRPNSVTGYETPKIRQAKEAAEKVSSG